MVDAADLHRYRSGRSSAGTLARFQLVSSRYERAPLITCKQAVRSMGEDFGGDVISVLRECPVGGGQVGAERLGTDV